MNDKTSLPTLNFTVDDDKPALELPPVREKVASPNFAWPRPPHTELKTSAVQEEAEPCLLIMANGAKLVGRLMFFLPDEQAINVQIPPSRTTLTIRFETFRALRLSNPVQVEEMTPDLPQAGESVVPFNIVYNDGKDWQGHTRGEVAYDFGHFLFLPDKSKPGFIKRVFIPKVNLSEIHVGSKLGELLVQENIVTPQQIDHALGQQRELREKKLGELLVEKNIVSADGLIEAIKRQESKPVMRLGEALLETGAITQAQLDTALNEQKNGRKKPLGELLVDTGAVTEEQLQLALAKKLGFPLIKLDMFPVEEEALMKIPAATATRLKILPILKRQQMLVVAMEDPWRYTALDELKFSTQLKIVAVMVPPRSVEAAIYKNYVDRKGPWQVLPESLSAGSLLPDFDFSNNNARSDAKTLASELTGGIEDGGEEKAVAESDNALVRLVNTMILDAYQQGASDIHVECYPGKEKVRVRFRRDGSLTQYIELPASHRSALIARLKIMADLDISEKRKPQDGKINFSKFGPARIELRLASIPTANGLEDMVLRILASAKPVPLDHLGLSKANVKGMHAIMERPYGLFLICGPTGSGKTTTLHSAISYINVPERKIWTAEDPVEITQPGLRQVQVLPKIGWTFAAALRAFLRADPDVIMVGEMRDEETARIGVEASLTGHLVLSTLHTNSAPESVTRLLDMGLDPFNFGDSLLGVLAQRLVKKMCMNCRGEIPADEDWINSLLEEYTHGMPDDPAFNRATVREQWLNQYGKNGKFVRYQCAGCEECNQNGLRGRVGIHELLTNSRAVKQLIQKGARAEEIQAQGLLDGLRTLKQDGIVKILQGLTTLEEVRAATAG